MTSYTTARDMAAGEFTGDGRADVASVWSSGLWYQNGATLAWTRVHHLTPNRIAAGDITGDGRDEIIGCGGEGPWITGDAQINSAAIDCIRNMSRYSREGRVEEYLNCFEPELRTRLERARDEMKRNKFADSLRRRAAPVRGIAFSDEIRLDEETIRIKVEWVFEDRNEIQHFMLKKAGDVWKIVDMTEARYKKPIIPYGTKVNE
jgi:hypothetical protein